MGKIDDEFALEAKRAELEEAAKEAERGKNKGGYTEIKWTGVTHTPDTLVLRFLGSKVDLHLGTSIPTIKNTDARVINLSRLIADNGKQMDLILPLYDRDSNHLLWRIHDKVNQVTWIKVKDDKDPKKENSVKKFINETKYPEIFNIVNYSGLPPDNLQRKFGLLGRGWKGKEVIIANVINRAMLEWHSTNKHSALLSKKITVKKMDDGSTIEYVDKGIPAYGTNHSLNKLGVVYGNWENYDIGFERTGKMDSPGEIFNACRTPEKIADEILQALVSCEPLSIEEASWERYDLDKLFKVTSYTKLWNRLHLTIEKIDACLGTFYTDELKKLADAETSNKEIEVEIEKEEEEVVEIEVVERKVVKSKTFEFTDLPGYKNLSDKEKSLIVSAEIPIEGTTSYKIQYSSEASKRIGACPECDTRSPEDFKSCPACGAKFTF